MIIYIALPQTLYFAYQLIVNDNFSLSFFHEKGRAMSEEKQAEEEENASISRLLISKQILSPTNWKCQYLLLLWNAVVDV